MDRPNATAEQYERYSSATVPAAAGAATSRSVARRARLPHLPGQGSAHPWPLPELRPGPGWPGCAVDRAPICTSCAGFSSSHACVECGQEGKLHAGRRCTRCTLARRNAELFDDGTGRIRPELAPLADLLISMDNPLSGLAWVSSRHGRSAGAADLLRGLGRGDIELTHDAFHRLQTWRVAAHLRELLMQCGVLPRIDKQVVLFERWRSSTWTPSRTPSSAGCCANTPPGTPCPGCGAAPTADPSAATPAATLVSRSCAPATSSPGPGAGPSARHVAAG